MTYSGYPSPPYQSTTLFFLQRDKSTDDNSENRYQWNALWNDAVARGVEKPTQPQECLGSLVVQCLAIIRNYFRIYAVADVRSVADP
jgi:hypothetical protein